MGLEDNSTALCVALKGRQLNTFFGRFEIIRLLWISLENAVAEKCANNINLLNESGILFGYDQKV